jgi:hypothetical protein
VVVYLSMYVSQVFTAWVNYHLSHKKVRIHNLEADLSDGVVLITLVEVLLDKHIDVSKCGHIIDIKLYVMWYCVLIL